MVIGLLAACAPGATAGAATLTESFDSWPVTDWTLANNSSPVGLQAPGWFQGTSTTATPSPGPFNAFNGAGNAYAAANFQSVAGANTISSWLITPSLSGLTQGDTVSFYTRRPTPNPTEYPDRLELRISTGGACSPGTGPTAVGDFTTLLLTVNPTLVTGVYPDAWTQFSATLPAMVPAEGCVAFRYHVTSGGPTGSNSDYIGLDQVEITDQPDDVTPETTIASGPSAPTQQTTASFTYSAAPSVGVGSYECRIRKAGTTDPEFATCSTNGTTYDDLADGSYSFDVRGVSHGGNVDATPATRSFTVDTTAPETTITAGPSGLVNSPDAAFEYATEVAEEDVAFECRLVGPTAVDPEFASCATTGETYELADGEYRFEARAKDALGNVDATPATREFTVDTTAPDTEIVSGPDDLVSASDVAFVYAASPTENDVAFECRLIGPGAADPEFNDCSPGEQSFAGLADGAYRFEVRARDEAGNVDPTPASRELTVDTTAPTATITSAPSAEITDGAATFAFTTTPADPSATVECRLNGATDAVFVDCPGGTKSYTGLDDGTYVFEVRATDAAGNVQAAPATATISVKRPVAPPVAPPVTPLAVPETKVVPPAEVAAPRAPTLSALHLSRTSFVAKRSGPTLTVPGRSSLADGRSSTLTFSATPASTVEFQVERVAGRGWKPLDGVVPRYVDGDHRATFRGRFDGETLKPGRYRLVAVAVDQRTKLRSAPRRVSFRITR